MAAVTVNGAVWRNGDDEPLRVSYTAILSAMIGPHNSGAAPQTLYRFDVIASDQLRVTVRGVRVEPDCLSRDEVRPFGEVPLSS